MQDKEKERLLREHVELETLRNRLQDYIVKLRAEQSDIRRIMEQMTTWKSGQSHEAFFKKYNDYFQTFSNKINDMEMLSASIHNKQKMVRNLINSMNMPVGPKW